VAQLVQRCHPFNFEGEPDLEMILQVFSDAFPILLYGYAVVRQDTARAKPGAL